MFRKMMDARKLKELEDKYNELKDVCIKHKKKLDLHEELLLKAARTINAMDDALGPVYEKYRKELKKDEDEVNDNIYG